MCLPACVRICVWQCGYLGMRVGEASHPGPNETMPAYDDHDAAATAMEYSSDPDAEDDAPEEVLVSPFRLAHREGLDSETPVLASHVGAAAEQAAPTQ
eukprot:10379853-Karenia_brevis.AAC.1